MLLQTVRGKNSMESIGKIEIHRKTHARSPFFPVYSLTSLLGVKAKVKRTGRKGGLCGV